MYCPAPVQQNIMAFLTLQDRLARRIQSGDDVEQVAAECRRHLDGDCDVAQLILAAEEAADEIQCGRLKEAGVRALQAHNLQAAKSAFTGMICALSGCRDDEVKERLLFTGYCNRSAVLFKAEEYGLCKDDALMALEKCEEDPRKRYALHDRIARCCFQLADLATAQEHLELAKQHAQMAKLPQELIQTISGRFSATMKSPPRSDDRWFSTCGLEPKVEIQFSPAKGRFAVASVDMQPGDVVASEQPCVLFSYIDEASIMSKTCHHCLGHFVEQQVFYPSPWIRGIRFCSRECLRCAVQTYHRHELVLLHDHLGQVRAQSASTKLDSVFMALRAVAAMPSAQLVHQTLASVQPNPAFVPSVPLPTSASKDHDGQLLQHLFHLSGHQEDLSEEDRLISFIRAFLLSEMLERSGYFKPTDSMEVKQTVLRVLHRLLIGIPHNAVQVYHVSGPVSQDIPLEAVGSAVYGKVMLFNHSCADKTSRFFQHGRVIVVAKRRICRGEEVSLNYGFHHWSMELKERQMALARSYKFRCTCDGCSHDFPLLRHVGSAVPDKVARKLSRYLAAYQRLFADGQMMEAARSCIDYLTTLEAAKVCYPDKSFEIGAIGLSSCWWAKIAQSSRRSQ